MSKTMRTLRIGFFPDFFYPHIGGAEIWVAEVAKRLHLSGHQIEIFTYRMPFAIKDEAIDGVTVHRVGWPFIVSGSRPYFIRFLILIEACFGIGLRRERFDIVLGQFTPLIPLKLVCKTRRIPLVALFHDVFGMEKKSGRWIMRSLAGYLAGDINARRQLLISLAYDGIVAVSDVVKNKIADINPSAKNIVVIRNGVDIGLVDSVVGKRNHKQVCYVGRLVESKNVNQLLEAFAIVRREEPESKLVIVGDGEDRMRLAALSKKLAVEGSVSFRGRVTDAEKFRIMKSSKVLAFPSKVGEGWGNVVTEAVCCGARVVGYDIPVLREQKTFLDSLMLVESGDVNAFARALLMALKSIETFDIEHDKKVIREELSWDRASGELESFLYEVVGSYVSGIDPRSRLF